MRRDAALFLIGAWVMGTIFMGVVATQNFYVIDRLLESVPNPQFGKMVDALGRSESREMLRYLSSELNRLFFQIWGWSQVAIGAAVVAMLWNAGARRVRWGALAMLLLALVLALGLMPPIVSIGRGLDFVPRDPRPPELAMFGLLHAAYTVADTLKLGAGFLLAYWIHRLPARVNGKKSDL